jgi:cobalt-zinc-cadmium efflux system outer membrane protein
MKKTIFYLITLLLSTALQAQSLEHYLSLALSNNPQLQALNMRYEIAEEKINQAAAVPKATFGAGYFASEPETRTGPQRFKLSVSQMLPWFGTLKARQDYARSLVETEGLDRLIVERQLALSLAQSYYRLYGYQQKMHIVETAIELFKSYEALALKAVENGSASVVNVLQLQIEQNKLSEEFLKIQELEKAEEVVFANLLSDDSFKGIQFSEMLEIPLEDLMHEQSRLAVNPEILKYDRLFAAVQQSEIVNQKEAQPSLGLGLDYIAVQQRSDVLLNENGKDILMPMLKLSVPLFKSKHSSVAQQLELRQRELNYEKNHRLNLLENKLAQAIALQNQAQISFKSQDANSAQTQKMKEVVLSNFESDRQKLTEVIAMEQLYLQFEFKKIEAVVQFYSQTALINYLIF